MPGFKWFFLGDAFIVVVLLLSLPKRGEPQNPTRSPSNMAIWITYGVYLGERGGGKEWGTREPW